MCSITVKLNSIKKGRLKSAEDRAQVIVSKLVASLIKDKYSVFCTPVFECGELIAINVKGLK